MALGLGIGASCQPIHPAEPVLRSQFHQQQSSRPWSLTSTLPSSFFNATEER